MTINASNYYTMKEYNDIIFNGIQYELPSDIIKIITYLENELSINESNANNANLTHYSSTTTHNYNAKNGSRNNNNRQFDNFQNNKETYHNNGGYIKKKSK